MILATGSTASAAQWLPAVRLTPEGSLGWFPEVATDIAGGVHAIWDMGIPGSDNVMYCSPTPAGCTHTRPIATRHGGDGNYVARAALAVDHAGTAHLIWRRKGLIVYTAAPVQPSLTIDGWRRMLRLGEGAYNALTLDDRGTLHAAWSEPKFGERTDPCFGCTDVEYSQSNDSGRSWSIPVNISNTSMSGSEKPHVAVARDGTIYVAWEEGRDHYAGKGTRRPSMATVSTDGGKTWNAPTSFEFPNDVPQSIAIGVDQHDHAVVVWRQVDGEGIYYQATADRGQSWSVPVKIEGVATRRSLENNLDDYDMAADGAGHLHLVMVGRPSHTQPEFIPNHVLHLEWDGSHWSAPHVLYTTTGAPEWPRIAVGNGNRLNAVWFERPAGLEWKNDQQGYSVWYAHGTSDATAVAAIAWPPLPPRKLSANDWWRIVQAALAVIIVTTVIGASRRRGW